MKTRTGQTTRPRGFTLIELLTVVAIISLLISILLPSLSRARDQARRAKTAGMLSGIDKALEMFHGDFDRYPDSSVRPDPIDWEGALTNSQQLCGSHWLARALVGHDYAGVDAQGLVMQGAGTPIIPLSDLNNADRTGTYMEGKMFARDDDSSKFNVNTTPTSDFTTTGRPVVYDESFGTPVLYYRANPRAQEPFGDVTGSHVGVYSHTDNAMITGATEASTLGWDFASTGARHPLASFAASGYDPTDPSSSHDFETDFNNSFVHFLHSKSAHQTANRLRAVNAERFVLIAAGKDGLFGTSDDICNFEDAAGR